MILALIILFSFFCYYLAKKRIIFLASHFRIKSRSLPRYYGINLAVWNFTISGLAVIAMCLYEHLGYHVNYTYAYLVCIAVFLTLLIYIYAALKGHFRAQAHFESMLKGVFNIAALVSILLTLAILFTILFEAMKFFSLVPIENFILGMRWSPQSGEFGVIPVLSGTILITFIAMCISIPLGIFSAIYLTEYTSKARRDFIKPVLEILAGIPTVVYGYFAALIVGPFIRVVGEKMGLAVTTESALAAGIVMGIMIIPFVLSLTDDAISSVPQNLRDASLALGSTKAEMIVKVIIPAASPGIIGAMLLAVSRAVGETMIVTMAAGIHAKLTLNPLDSVSTFTAQIVALLVGDHEFDSAKTLSAFALALTLFIMTLFLNLWAVIVIKRHSKRNYE